MTAKQLKVVACSTLIGVLFPLGARSQNFDACEVRAEQLWNGTDSLGFTPEEISRYLYRGPVKGMDPFFNRSHFMTLTTEGCLAVCNDPTDWYWTDNPTLTLGIISNWILPIIASLATLPYDSAHKRRAGQPWYRGRVIRTLASLLNWLGSPQTALTATIFNIHQTRKCLRGARRRSADDSDDVKVQTHKLDAYYILSAIGQYKLREPDSPDERFISALVYGLLRPIMPDSANQNSAIARVKATALLEEMSFQLRMLRRRGVYPAFISILLFFVAYAVSLVLAFGGLGDRATAHSLALGILVSWLPLFLLFAILDRNPVSEARVKKLIARWLWNADAVRNWEMQSHPTEGSAISWWSQEREDDVRAHQEVDAQTQKLGKQRLVGADWRDESHKLKPTRKQRRMTYMQSAQKAAEAHKLPDAEAQTPIHGVPAPVDSNNGGFLFDDHILDFVGQGREVGYFGLTAAVANSIYNERRNSAQVRSIESAVNHTLSELLNHRAISWHLISVVSLALVWLEITMAVMISYNTPTVGFSCRSGSYVVYGILSTIPWLLHLLHSFKHPSHLQRAFLHVWNSLAVLSLFFIIFAQFSGVFNDCRCKGGLGGYMDFASSDFYRDHFDVDQWWTAGATVGGLPLFGSFVASVIVLISLKPLWKASEEQRPPAQASTVDMMWLT